MSKTKAFFKAFVITFLIMSAISALMLVEIPDLSKPKQNQNSTSFEGTQLSPTVEDKFSVFLTLTTTPDSVPYAYFLLNFDGPERSLNILRLPSQTVLSKSGEKKIILSEQFSRGASPLALRAICNYFNCNISRYIAIDNRNLNTLFSLFDPTEIEITQDLSQIDREKDIYIKIDKGLRLLSASTMIDLISATAWQGGQKQTMYESANALAVFLNQNGDKIFKNSSCKLENFILNHTTNNFSVMDFEKRRDAISYILSAKNSAHSALIDGEYINADTEFVPNYNSFLEVQKMLEKY